MGASGSTKPSTKDMTKKTIGPIVRRLMPRVVAKHLYRRMALKYIADLEIPVDRERKTILVLNHFYDQDVRALRRANKDYNVVSIHTPTLFKGAKIFFREDVQAMNAPYSDEDPANLAEYRKECERIFDALKQKFGAHLMVTAADNFYWIRELIDVARSQGVKTLFVDKEGLLSPYTFESDARRIRENAPYISDHLFVWSERQKQFWMKTGVPEQDITILGQLRSDLFRQEMTFVVDGYFGAKRPLITFFTYEDDAYVPLNLVASEGLSWKDMKIKTQDLLAEIADAHPEYNFVFKAHPQQSDLDALQLRYDRPNLKVIGGASIANELIVRSELIVAFQTTAVLEAMFMNKRLIYTAWDPSVERLSDQILPFDKAPGVVVAKSYEHFKQVCERFFSGNASDFAFSDEEEDRKHAMVSEYFYKPNGHVCERFFTEIGRFMA